jgi:hypothetical protein
MGGPAHCTRAFTPIGTISAMAVWSVNVTDIIVVVLSTGGILLMGAYAVLCDKI